MLLLCSNLPLDFCNLQETNLKVNAVLAAAEAEVKAEAAAAAAAIKWHVGQMTAALERKAADIHARAKACLGCVIVHFGTASYEGESLCCIGRFEST